MESCIAFVTNTNKANTASVRRQAIQTATEKGYRCIEVANAGELLQSDIPFIRFLVSIGGDGTILHAVPFATEYGLPILGINMGRVGFLSEITADEFATALDKFSKQEYMLDKRMTLQCTVNGKDAGIALNEILVYRHSNSGTAQVGQYINGLDAGSIFCDGIIVCTPTGATGYSISAGGPVAAPGMDACIITPICPHTLTAKPIVAAPESIIEFRMFSKGMLIADGAICTQLQQGDCIRVCRAESTVNFIRFEEKNLFQLIKNKLT